MKKRYGLKRERAKVILHKNLKPYTKNFNPGKALGGGERNLKYTTNRQNARLSIGRPDNGTRFARSIIKDCSYPL